MDEGVNGRLLRELREQVNILLSASHLLSPLVREKGSAQDLDCLAMADQTLYRLMRTVQHLELSQPGPLPFLPELTDTAQICQRLGENLALLSPDLKVDFSWSVEPGGLTTLADPLLVERALLNLITNAIQAAGQGGKVWLRASSQGGRILLTVEDNGPGMGDDPQLTVPQGDDPFLKQSGGLGLGIELAKKTAQLHGGALLWHDRAGGGLSVTLSLPLRKPDSSGQLVKTPSCRKDMTGGFSTLLVELSPLLPPEQFHAENIE